MAEVRNGQLPNGDQIRVTFDSAPPYIVGGIGTVFLEALVERAIGGPYQGATVQFFSGSDPIDVPTQTNDKGFAKALCPNLAPGNHPVTVRVGDVEVPMTIVIDPDTARVNARPSDGKQRQRSRQKSQTPSEVHGTVNDHEVTFMLQKSMLNDQVILNTILLTESGERMEGQEIEFTWAGELQGQVPTNSQGMARMPIAFADKSPGTYQVAAQVVGAALIAREAVTLTATRAVLPNVVDAKEILNRTQYGEERFHIRLLRVEGNNSQGVKGKVRVSGFEDGQERFVEVDDIGGVTYPPYSQGPLRHTRAIELTFVADNVVKKEVITLDQPARYPDPPRPPANLGFLARWRHRLYYNNNWRAIFFWVLFIILMIVQTQLFGCSEPRDWATIEAKEFEAKTGAERYFAEEWRQALRLPIPQESSMLTKQWIWIGSWTWFCLTSLLLPWCIFYTFWVMRDEVWGVVEDARRMIRERREGTTHTPASPEGSQNTQSQRGGVVIRGQSLSSDFMSNVAANMLDRVITGFFRKLS